MEVRQPVQTQRVLGIVAALPQEVGGLLRLGRWERLTSHAASRLYRGAIGGTDVLLSVSGMGRAAAESATEELLQRFRPGAVLSIGFAGGLAPRVGPGALIAAGEIVRADSPEGDTLRPDYALQRCARNALATTHLSHSWGLLMTESEVVASPADKARLGAATGALAVDMESGGVGDVCRRYGTPFLAARAVVDAVGDELPHFFVDITSGSFGPWRMARLLAQPWHYPRLLRLGRAAALARASLTAFVEAFAAVWATSAREPEGALPVGRQT